jgi:type IV pilus assembly protein PilM
MQSILSKVKLGTESGRRPPGAVELAPEGVLAAALPARGQAPVYAFQPLAAGSLVPGVGEPNVRAAEAVANAIRSTLGQVAPRSRAVTLVIPDTVVRVFVLDFDSLPGKAEEAYPVLRFRLRKMVPFDIEHAAVSYQVLTQSKSELKVLTAVIPGAILAEYEEAVRAAGYEPGAVLSSSLASLAGIDSLEAALVANFNGLALTTSITNGNDLLLYRTLDLPEDPALRLNEVRRGVAVAAAYFEDKLQAPPSRLLYSGDGNAQGFAQWIDNPDLAVDDLAPRPEVGIMTALGDLNIAAVTGALAEAG